MPPKKVEKKADGDGPSPDEELKEYAMKNTTLELQLRECSLLLYVPQSPTH